MVGDYASNTPCPITRDRHGVSTYVCLLDEYTMLRINLFMSRSSLLYVCAVVAFLLVVAYVSSDRLSRVREIRVQRVENPHSADLFQRVDTVRLSNEIVIARIDEIDVAPNGDFLIVDKRSSQAILFDQNGNVKRKVKPSDCNPGFSGRPSRGGFITDGIVLITTGGGGGGYRFNRNGECRGNLDEEFFLPLQVVSDFAGHIYGFFAPRGLEESARIVKTDSTGKISQTFWLPRTDLPVTALMLRSEGLVYADGYVFYAAASVGPDVYRFSSENGDLDILQVQAPAFYRPITEDRANAYSDGRSAVIKEISELFSSSSVTDNIFRIDQNRLLVQWVDMREGVERGKHGLQAIDTDGRLIGETIGRKFPIRVSQGEYAYSWEQPGLDENGELPNPYIYVDKYIGP